MTTDEMLLEIEQTSKYGTPLLTHHAIAILAKLRAAEALAMVVEKVWEENEGGFDELEYALNAYNFAGKEPV